MNGTTQLNEVALNPKDFEVRGRADEHRPVVSPRWVVLAALACALWPLPLQHQSRFSRVDGVAADSVWQSPVTWAASKVEKVLYVLENSLPSTLNPLAASTISDYRVMELIHDGPFVRDEAGLFGASLIATQDGQANYSTRASSSQGHQRALGELKIARFHNGMRISVADLEATLRAYEESSRTGHITTRWYDGLYGEIKGVPPQPERNFDIEFSRRLRDTRVALTVKLLPRAAFQRPNDPKTFCVDQQYGVKGIGAGPFKVTAPLGSNRTKLVLEAFEQYHRGRARLDRIEIVAVPSPTEKLNAFRADQAHVIVSLNKSDQTLFKEAGAIVRPYFIRNAWYLGFNQTQSALLRIGAVRRALSMVVDREELALQLADEVHTAGEASLPGRAVDELDAIPIGWGDPNRDATVTLISGPFVPESPYYNKHVKQPRPNVTAARKLMATVPGVSEDSRGKWLYKHKPIRFNIAVRKDLPGARDVFSVLRQQLLDFGISVIAHEVDQQDWEYKRRKMDLLFGRWNYDQQDSIRPIFSSNGPLNFFGYSNDKLEQVLDAADVETDYDQKVRLMWRAHEILATDLPCIFLWEASQVAAFSPRVTGYKIHAFSFYVNPHRWDLLPPTR